MARIEHHFSAMGGPCRLRVDSENEPAARSAIHSAEEEVRRLERKYSRYLPDSLTSKINRLAGGESFVTIDEETAGLLNYAQTLWRESDGLFDLTSGVLRRAWDFKSSRLPQQEELDSLLSLVAWDRVEWDATSVRLPDKGMELDFGGCVKEYACDSAAAVLRRANIESALVDLSGDIAAVGVQASGEAWQIGIRHPGKKAGAIAHIPLACGGLASSGNYERFMELNGRRYGHIINPKSGWPVQGLVAVSALADQCLVAGSTATIAMLMPAPEALVWLDGLGISWLAVDTRFNIHGTIDVSGHE